MNRRHRLLLALPLTLLPCRASAQTLPPPAQRQLARDILQELVEINTVGDSGTTRAAEALARRLTAAGFSPEDVLLAGPSPRKQNLVVRFRGRGRGEPILTGFRASSTTSLTCGPTAKTSGFRSSRSTRACSSCTG